MSKLIYVKVLLEKKVGVFLAVECFKCKYFHITWDQYQPRGCKAYGFKTARIPSLVVKENSGQECSLYTPKDEVFRGDSEELDLSDKQNW